MRRRWVVALAVVAGSLLVGTLVFATTPADPDAWNMPASRRDNNNCYNYACNFPNGTFAQPGHRATPPMPDAPPPDCAGVGAAAVADGLSAADASGSCPAECCRVALVIAHQRVDTTTTPPTVYIPDYHWYREDVGGMWSHKPGQGDATDVDSSGAPISDPSMAGRDTDLGLDWARTTSGALVQVRVRLNYDEFCGYYCVCPGALDIGRLQADGGQVPAQSVPPGWYDGGVDPRRSEVPTSDGGASQDAGTSSDAGAPADAGAPTDAGPDAGSAHPCVGTTSDQAECYGCCELHPSGGAPCFTACDEAFMSGGG